MISSFMEKLEVVFLMPDKALRGMGNTQAVNGVGVAGLSCSHGVGR